MNAPHIIILFWPRILLLAVMCIQPAMAADFSSGIFKYQTKMANNGHAKSHYKLGNMYASGRGTQKDSVAARKWYAKAAAQNYQPAKNRLVYLEIIEKGYNKGKHEAWLKKLHVAAKNSDAEAALLLGGMYKKGFVVNKNLKTARNYYRRAISQGLPGAEIELESIGTMLDAEKKQRLLEQEKKKQAQLKKQQQAEQAQRLKRQEKARKRKAQQKKSAQARLAEKHRKAREKQRLTQQRKKKAAEKLKQKEVKTSKPVVKPEECDGPWAKHMVICQ